MKSVLLNNGGMSLLQINQELQYEGVIGGKI
jgi:hypothetical protein